MFNDAYSSTRNPWQLSDHYRNTRKIQSVKCLCIFAQDHRFKPIKSYQKCLGAKAAWTVGTETGETAAVSVVPTTETDDFAHAA